jgi:hypothetical protein
VAALYSGLPLYFHMTVSEARFALDCVVAGRIV